MTGVAYSLTWTEDSDGLDAWLARAADASGASREDAIRHLRCWLGFGRGDDDERILALLESVCADSSDNGRLARAAAADVLRRALRRPDHGLGGLLSGRDWNWAGLDLRGCHLTGVDLRRAHLRHAWLDGANLGHALLDGVDASHARMTSASLPGASLVGAECSGAHLGWADMSGADLRGIRLNGATLAGAILNGARAVGAFFSDADLTRASLSDANLEDANLFGARMNGAHLDGTILRGTGITPERLRLRGWRAQWRRSPIWGREDERDGRNPLAASSASGRVVGRLSGPG